MNVSNIHTNLYFLFSHGDFFTIINLPEGDHQYKFNVDGTWQHNASEVKGELVDKYFVYIVFLVMVISSQLWNFRKESTNISFMSMETGCIM